MKLPKIPNPINFFKWLLPKSKKIKKEEALLREYNNKRILQVDNNVDNKKYLLGLETA